MYFIESEHGVIVAAGITNIKTALAESTREHETLRPPIRNRKGEIVCSPVTLGNTVKRVFSIVGGRKKYHAVPNHEAAIQ